MAADLVVGATDLHHVETQLLPAAAADLPGVVVAPAGPRPRRACWCMLGVRATLPQLAHHSLFFTRRLEGELRRRLRLAPDRCRSPRRSTSAGPQRTDPSVARPAREPLRARARAGRPVHRARRHRRRRRRPRSRGSRTPSSRRSRRGPASRTWPSGSSSAARSGPGDFVDDLNAWQGRSAGPRAHAAAERVPARPQRRRARSRGCTTPARAPSPASVCRCA